MFVHDDGETLRMFQEAAEEGDGVHRLGDERRRGHLLGVVGGGIEEKGADVEHAEDVVGRLAIDGHAAEAARAELGDEFLIGEVIGDGESIDARGHAVLRVLVAELDNLLDHLAFVFLERAFLGAEFHEGLEFVFVQEMAGAEMSRGDRVGDFFTQPLEDAGEGIEHGGEPLHDAHADLRDAVRLGEGGEFRHEIADDDDEAEDRERGDPERKLDAVPFMQDEKAEDDEREIGEGVGEEDGTEQAPGIFHEARKSLGKAGAAFFQPLDVKRLEREEGGLDGREERRAEDQHDERGSDEGERVVGHQGASGGSVFNRCLSRTEHGEISFALSTRAMKKSDRISAFVETLDGDADGALAPEYLGFFTCFNEGKYYEAHDVLEHLWLRTKGADHLYFKGLIQVAGAFVHLQKQHLHPTHPKHATRLRPAARLFRLGAANLEPYGEVHLRLDVAALVRMCRDLATEMVAADFARNPWSPACAPQIHLGGKFETRSSKLETNAE